MQAWLKGSRFTDPAVDVVQFWGSVSEVPQNAEQYPEWFIDFMEDELWLLGDYGITESWYYGDLAVSLGSYFLKNRIGTIAYIEKMDFETTYDMLPF